MKDAYTHLAIADRKIIECSLNEGDSFRRIAARIGFDVSTVRREILRNRRFEGSSLAKGKDKNDCAHLKTCSERALCRNGCLKLCRACPKPCHELGCDRYEPRACPATERAPFVCNACARFGRCTLPRYRYSAESADALARNRARESREGVDLDPGEMESLIDAVRGGLILGQSIHHIFQTCDLPCSERSFYRYVEEERVPILSIELAKKVRCKKRKKRAKAHESGFYAGHSYDDFLELDEEERARVTEVDTVMGRARDRKCILSLHRKDLHFQIYLLLPEKTKEKVVGALDWLEACCIEPGTGKSCFPDLFGLMLLDRGCEFDGIAEMERSAIDPSKKRCSCCFADPSRPDQKGSCEKNTTGFRR